MTDSEQMLWSELRKRQVAGCRFRRQHPLGSYIVDFVCLDKRIIVEIDGGHHDEPEQIEHDRYRTRWLEERGFVVFRVWNAEVFDNLHGVVDTIWAALQERPSYPRTRRAGSVGPPPPPGRAKIS